MKIVPLWNSWATAMKDRFGCKVAKICVDGGFSCPNRDGTTGYGGCIFCNNNAFSPAAGKQKHTITEQINSAILKRSKSNYKEKFLAYFQPYSNTYGDVVHLENLYREALLHPEIDGLIVSTRPDCINRDNAELLKSLSAEKYVSIEIGVQSTNQRLLDWMGRGHGFDAVQKASSLFEGSKVDVCYHVILGLPDEGKKEVQEMAIELSRLKFDSVKLHNLHILKSTKLEAFYHAGTVSLTSLEQHASLVADFLEKIPWCVTVQRISGDAPDEFLIAPKWSQNYTAIKNAIEREFIHRGTKQGAFYCRG